MPPHAPTRMLACMSESNGNVITAALEVALAEGAPRGVLSCADCPHIRFTGWTELASAIENWREEASQPVREGVPAFHARKRERGISVAVLAALAAAR